MLCCVALRCVALRCVVLCCVVLCCVALRCVVLCCVMLCCVVLRCAVLCCVVLCCVVLCCVVLCSFYQTLQKFHILQKTNACLFSPDQWPIQIVWQYEMMSPSPSGLHMIRNYENCHFVNRHAAGDGNGTPRNFCILSDLGIFSWANKDVHIQNRVWYIQVSSNTSFRHHIVSECHLYVGVRKSVFSNPHLSFLVPKGNCCILQGGCIVIQLLWFSCKAEKMFY